MSPNDISTLIEKIARLDGRLEGTTDGLDRLDRNLSTTQEVVHRYSTQIEVYTNAFNNFQESCKQNQVAMNSRIKRLSERVHAIDGEVEKTGRINVAAMARAEGRREFYARARHTLIQAGKLLAWTLGVISVGIGVAAALAAIGGCTVPNKGALVIGQGESYNMAGLELLGIENPQYTHRLFTEVEPRIQARLASVFTP